MKAKATSPKLTPEILAQLAAVNAMREEDIDLTEMPEILDWSKGERGKFYRPIKKQVTLRLDADLIEWFKTKQGGARGYQTRINAALRKVVEGERRKAGRQGSGEDGEIYLRAAE